MDVYLINCSKSKFALVRVLTGIKWSANEVVMEFQNILPPSMGVANHTKLALPRGLKNSRGQKTLLCKFCTVPQ
jgi:hypothetical protein